MNSFQSRIEEFMVKGKQIPADGAYLKIAPEIREGELRKSIILEEAKEFADAIDANDLPEAVDACIDLLYVVLGALSKFGIDAEPYFRAVHEANMAKLKDGIIRRPDGKIIKPKGWKPPDIAAMIAFDTKHRLAALPGPFGEPGDPDDPIDWRKK